MWIFRPLIPFCDHCVVNLVLCGFVVVVIFPGRVSCLTKLYTMEDRCSHLIDMHDQKLTSLRLILTDSALYRPHISCLFAVRAPPRKRLVIVVEWLDIAEGRSASCADFLSVSDGDFQNITGPVHGLKLKLCGQVQPPPVTSAGQAVTLKFDSTTHDHGAGFSILFTAFHQGPCHEHEFTCDNGRCIDKRLKCNDNDNCGDKSDDCKLTAGDVVVAVIVTALVFSVIIGLACLWCHRDKVKLRFQRKCPVITANPDGVYQPTTEPVKGSNMEPLTML